MRSVPISDKAFIYAERAAAAKGVSLPDYLETLIIHDGIVSDEDSITLTAEQIDRVREGQADVKAGRVYTPAEVRQRLQDKHDEWLRTHSH